MRPDATRPSPAIGVAIFNGLGRARAALSALVLACLVAAPFLCAPAYAQDGWDAQLSARAVSAKRAVAEGNDIDSSGFGLRGEIGHTRDWGETAIRIEVDATVFDYTEKDRATREGIGLRASVNQRLSDELHLEIEARRAENLVALEAASADQTSVRGQLQWEKGNDRLRVHAEYRQREYDVPARSSGEGVRVGVQYNRRLGPYHWVRFDLRHEDMDSADALRGYRREVAAVDYSHPITRAMRLRAGVEARRWRYDGRLAQGADTQELRRDSVIAPEAGVSWGSEARGFYGNARASYEFRTSNDVRYGADAPRFDLMLGYRF